MGTPRLVLPLKPLRLANRGGHDRYFENDPDGRLLCPSYRLGLTCLGRQFVVLYRLFFALALAIPEGIAGIRTPGMVKAVGV